MMSVVDLQHLETLMQASEAELQEIQTRIQTLEVAVAELDALRLKATQLQQFQAGLTPLLQGGLPVKENPTPKRTARPHAHRLLPEAASGAFFPERAFEEADAIIRHRQSVNYEIFRAVVLNGGQATNAEIRRYLIEQEIRTPQGKTFQDAKLSEISARVAYLVKRQVLYPIGPGRFRSCFGWGLPNS